MKSVKAKSKVRQSSSKFGRGKFPPKREVTPDLSQLRPPIDTSVSTLYRVTKILENGSDEVKSILAHECDLVYECRVCRSLFRSLANFISHKRIYCKQRYDVTYTRISSNDCDIFLNEFSTAKTEKSCVNSCGNDRVLRSKVPKEEQKKDLTAVVSMLQKRQIENLEIGGQQLYLQNVHTNRSAVYQTLQSAKSPRIELMKEQVLELKSIGEQSAMLGSNGLVQESNELRESPVVKDYNNDEIDSISENNIVCSICNAKFSTKKTLAVHTRTLHTSHRLCYPCPCCSSTFANTWSAYRHLFKVHRKSNDQVRKLRSQIQEKAFMKDTSVAEDMRKEDAEKSLMSKALRVNETREWIDHLESDTELQRCGGCGKRFDRKAALSSHSQYCHRRVAVYESTSKVKKLNKHPSDCPSSNESCTIDNVNVHCIDVILQDSSVSTEIINSDETPIRVESVSTLSKADWDMMENVLSGKTEANQNVATDLANDVTEYPGKNSHSSTKNGSDSLEIMFSNVKCKSNFGSRKRKNKDTVKKFANGTEIVEEDVEVSSENTKKEVDVTVDYVLLMEKKIASIINLQKIQCLPCKRKFTSVNNLRRHAAIHIGWNRYKCKLCDYKCFVKCDCVTHCNKMHNAQNNRVIIEDMIVRIPDDQYNKGIMLSLPNLEEETEDVPQIIKVVTPCSEEASVQSKKEITMEVRKEDPVIPPPETIKVTQKEVEALSNDIKGQNTLDLDPELRKMVMEVIFGSDNVNSSKESDEIGVNQLGRSNAKSQKQEEVNVQSKKSDTKDIASLHDNTKQRPIRNKIKPLNKDFIYDLKEEGFQRDPLIIKPFSKSFVKKPVLQKENNLEKDHKEQQPSKRLKSMQSDKISISCDNSILGKCDEFKSDLKNNLSYSQCHS